jgi:hypothetical protein
MDDMNDDWSAQPLHEENPIEMGEIVLTPVGYGKVIDLANTPVGMVYRVETLSGVKDFFEQDVRAADKSMALRAIMSSTEAAYNKFITDEDLHYESMRKYGPIHSHDRGKKHSAIDPFLIEGEHMYHGTPAKNVKNILQHGLLPHDVNGESISRFSENNPRFTPRPNHAYIGSQNTAANIPDKSHGNNVKPWIRVDMSKVDPKRVNADEDWFDNGYWLHDLEAPDHVISTRPPGIHDTSYGLQDMDKEWEPWRSEHGTLGEWAESHKHWIDQPENVAHSFMQGSVGVEGGVPADALHLNPELSGEDYQTLANIYGQEWVNKELARSREMQRAAKVATEIPDEMRRPWLIQDWRNPEGSVIFGEPGATIATLGVPTDTQGTPMGFIDNRPSGYVDHGKVVPLAPQDNQYITQVQHAYNQQYKVKDSQMRSQYIVGQQPNSDFDWQPQI